MRKQAMTILIVAILAGAVQADLLITPTTSGTGYIVRELTPGQTVQTQPAPPPAKYVWIRVAKSQEELRMETYIRDCKLRERAQIAANNYRIDANRIRTNPQGYHESKPGYGRGVVEKIPPIQRYRWVCVKIG